MYIVSITCIATNLWTLLEGLHPLLVLGTCVILLLSTISEYYVNFVFIYEYRVYLATNLWTFLEGPHPFLVLVTCTANQ